VTGKAQTLPAWVYIVTNKRGGVLYVGFTSDLKSRIRQHKSGKGSKFTGKYNLARLVYFEPQASATAGRKREQQLKAWHRDWKVRLIEIANPEWLDLGQQIA
jgi:putative endonuclease